MIIIDADIPKNCRLCFIVRGKCPVYKNQHFMNGKVITSKPLQEGCLIKGEIQK